MFYIPLIPVSIHKIYIKSDRVVISIRVWIGIGNVPNNRKTHSNKTTWSHKYCKNKFYKQPINR